MIQLQVILVAEFNKYNKLSLAVSKACCIMIRNMSVYFHEYIIERLSLVHFMQRFNDYTKHVYSDPMLQMEPYK